MILFKQIKYIKVIYIFCYSIETLSKLNLQKDYKVLNKFFNP